MTNFVDFYLPDPGNIIGEQISFVHDHAFMFMIFIISFVFMILWNLMSSKIINRMILYNEALETLWTLIPILTLILIALPSLSTLLISEEYNSPTFTLKVVGHQWYWSYEYSDFSINFDSYMIDYKSSNKNDFRLLDVSNRVVLPTNINFRVVLTSMDVIHSWAVPSMFIKMDANPGRLNQVITVINQPGLFFGQCSEICGPLHSFMPIVVEAVDWKSFINWVKDKY